MTAPTCFRGQVERVAAWWAMPMKYSFQPARISGLHCSSGPIREQLFAATYGNVTRTQSFMRYPHKSGLQVSGNRGVMIIGRSAEIGGFHPDFSLTRPSRFI